MYIGQGATGLVYRASIMQPCDAIGLEAALPGPVSVAVKFMICNTPQQLWQRAKEALLSKLVSHPNLVRTLAMDVTLVTPNTYHDWGSRQRASLDAVGLAAIATNPPLRGGPDGAAALAPHTPGTLLAASRLPLGSAPCSAGAAAAAAGAAATAGCAAVGAAATGAAATGAATATDMTTSDHDPVSDTIPAVAEELSASRAPHPDPPSPRQQAPCRRTPAPECASPRLPTAATAAAPAAGLGGTISGPQHQSAPVLHPQAAPPLVAGSNSSSGGGARRPQGIAPRTLGAIMAAAHGSFSAGAAAGESPVCCEAPCTVEPSELWPGCCGSSMSGVGSHAVSKAPSAARERSWARQAGSGGGSGSSRERCGEVAAGGDGGGAILRLQLSSGLMRNSGCAPGASRGSEGSEGSVRTLSVTGDGDRQLAGEGGSGVGAVAAAAAAAGTVVAAAVLGNGGVAGPAGAELTASAGPSQSPPQSFGSVVPAMPTHDGRALLAANDAATFAAAMQGLRIQHALAWGGGSLPAAQAGGVQQSGAGGAKPGTSGGGGGGSSSHGGGGGGAHRSGPVPFQEILYYLEALPGRFLAKVIMEYCDSGTLLQRINSGEYVAHPDKGPLAMLLAMRALLWCLQEVAAGMAHLHSLNIIHGDLKPGNVLLTTQADSPLGYVCKVSDFGLATALEASEQTITHENWGTVVYMAPESCAGRCRKASDVYSFGVLIWQMCTGERPYAGMQAGQVLLGVKTGTLKLQWPAWANKSLVKVGQACLRFEPKERPGFKGIRSALAKIAVRLDQKIAAVETASRMHTGATLIPAASASSAVAAAAAVAPQQQQLASGDVAVGSGSLHCAPGTVEEAAAAAAEKAAATDDGVLSAERRGVGVGS